MENVSSSQLPDNANVHWEWWRRSRTSQAIRNGKIVHGEIAICGSTVMIGDPGDGGFHGDPRKLGGCTADLHITVDDNEALLHRATSAGAEEVHLVTDIFYGASAGSVRDSFGRVWVLLSWKVDLETAELERRGAALQSQ